MEVSAPVAQYSNWAKVPNWAKARVGVDPSGETRKEGQVGQVGQRFSLAVPARGPAAS